MILMHKFRSEVMRADTGISVRVTPSMKQSHKCDPNHDRL